MIHQSTVQVWEGAVIRFSLREPLPMGLQPRSTVSSPHTCPPRRETNCTHGCAKNSMSVQEDSNRVHARGMSCTRPILRGDLLCMETSRSSFSGLPPYYQHFRSTFIWRPFRYGTLSNIGETTASNIIVPPVSESKSTSNKPARLAS